MTGALGFARVHFKNLWLWWDPAIDDDKIYLVNTSFIEFRVHPMDEFAMTKWKEEVDQPRGRHAQITTTCTPVFLSRDRHCVLFNIGETS